MQPHDRSAIGRSLRIAGIWSQYRQRILFVAVGGWNTIFGVALFVILHSFLPQIHYIFLLIFCNELAILNAFVGYRWVVFCSKGKIGGELLRFHGVYAISAVLGISVTAGLVELAGFRPVIANALSTIITIVASYIGHSRFSFGSKIRPHERSEGDSSGG
jgi:putative flippase GtrA